MKQTTKNHKKAIEIIAGDHDWKAICVQVAINNPSVLIKAVGFDRWEPYAKELVDDCKKIEAIKYCREVTGKSLKDAKLAVEAL